MGTRLASRQVAAWEGDGGNVRVITSPRPQLQPPSSPSSQCPWILFLGTLLRSLPHQALSEQHSYGHARVFVSLMNHGVLCGDGSEEPDVLYGVTLADGPRLACTPIFGAHPFISQTLHRSRSLQRRSETGLDRYSPPTP